MKLKFTSSSFGALGCAILMICCGPAIAQGQYHITAQWKVGGNTGWDYLAIDPASKLLYVAHGDHVVVINTSSGKVKADIAGLKGTHGIAFDSSGKFGYISDGRANQVVVFDRKTDAILQRIPAGTNPDGIMFEPVTQTIWAFNGRSKNATVIDDKTHQVVATVPLPGKPEFPVADGKGSIYDNIENLSEIVHIDARTHKVLAAWPIAPCEGPSGLAIDKQHQRLFAVCDGKMAIVNASTGKVVAMPSIGDGPDAARFDPKYQLAFSSNGQGTLSVVHENSPDSYSVIQTLPTRRGARTMTLDETTGKIYLATAAFSPPSATTAKHPHSRRSIMPGSFEIIVVSR